MGDEQKSIKVLLTDDSASFLHFEKVLLSGTGYRFITATTGTEAYKLTKQEKPDIILLDINMPELTGFECCRLIKNDAEVSDIPVIMVTTRGAQNDIDAAFEAGCDDYLFKPVKKNVLVEMIEKHLKKKPEAPA
jgi:DNA-binding response OmpR family regulator